MSTYKRKYFTDFLSEIGGLFTALMAAARFMYSGYQNFAYMLALIVTSYAQEEQASSEVE